MAVTSNPKGPTNKPTPAAPPPAASAKPGTKDDKAKAKAKRVDYAAPDKAEWVDDKGLFTRLPDDFDQKKHLPLKKKQFADEYAFLILRAEQLEKQAVKMRELAEQSKKLGNVKDRVKAKRLVQLTARLEELKKSLAETMSPEEIAALIGTAAVKTEENAAAPAA
jgi:hypothetical protein